MRGRVRTRDCASLSRKRWLAPPQSKALRAKAGRQPDHRLCSHSRVVKEPPTVILVDASPYLFRAWFSLPRSIVDPQGRPVNAVYGFASFLAKYSAEERPTHVGVTFDRHFNHSFRNDFYPPYKAHRETSPPELDAQVDPSVEVVEALGAATFIDPRYEADDLIATIIDRTGFAGTHYVIVTTDKDLTQLVSDRVTVVDPARRLRFDPAAVEAKFGVRPDQMTDYLGLVGDAVDNIP